MVMAALVFLPESTTFVVAEVLDEKSEEAVCRAVEALAGAYKLDPRACRWIDITFDFEEA